MTDPAVVIVGAGAAGVGAAMALRGQGVPFVMLEAADRIGGRAYTDRASLPGHWDRGCQWFHSADINPLVAEAGKVGTVHERIDRTGDSATWAQGRWLAEAEIRAQQAQISASFEAIYKAAEAGNDVPIAEVIPDGGKWAPVVRHLLQLLGCDDPERISARGYGQYQDTGVNWLVTSGYGDLFERMAVGMPVRRGIAVTAVRHEHGNGVAVETAAGQIRARSAIVTVSTGVLNAGAIAFGPGPARELLDLVADVPCGNYEKVAFAFSALPEGMADKLLCWVDPGQGALPSDFQIDTGKHPKMIAHIAGSVARDLKSAGDPAMIAFATERLEAAFGSGVRKLIVKTAVTDWQNDPFVRGGYSYTRTGAADRRLAMIAAETGPIAFAGEAFSLRAQATAHGAWQSGQDVANRLIRSERLA